MKDDKELKTKEDIDLEIKLGRIKTVVYKIILAVVILLLGYCAIDWCHYFFLGI